MRWETQLNSCDLSQHSISQAQAFYPWIYPISVCTAIFQGFVMGHICQQSSGRNRKKATCISSSFFFLQPSHALDEQTNSHAEDDQPNLHPREATVKLPQPSADFAPQPQKPANHTHMGGGEELRHSPMAVSPLKSVV